MKHMNESVENLENDLAIFDKYKIENSSDIFYDDEDNQTESDSDNGSEDSGANVDPIGEGAGGGETVDPETEPYGDGDDGDETTDPDPEPQPEPDGDDDETADPDPEPEPDGDGDDHETTDPEPDGDDDETADPDPEPEPDGDGDDDDKTIDPEPQPEPDGDGDDGDDDKTIDPEPQPEPDGDGDDGDDDETTDADPEPQPEPDGDDSDKGKETQKPEPDDNGGNVKEIKEPGTNGNGENGNDENVKEGNECCQFISRKTKDLNCFLEDNMEELTRIQEKIESLGKDSENKKCSDKIIRKLKEKQHFLEETIVEIEKDLNVSKELDEISPGEIYQELLAIKAEIKLKNQPDEKSQEMTAIQDKITALNEEVVKLEAEITSSETSSSKNIQFLKQVELKKKMLKNKKTEIEILEEELQKVYINPCEIYFEKLNANQHTIIENLFQIHKTQLEDINKKQAAKDWKINQRNIELKKINILLEGLNYLCPEPTNKCCSQNKCQNSQIVNDKKDQCKTEVTENTCCDKKLFQQKVQLKTRKAELEKELEYLNI